MRKQSTFVRCDGNGCKEVGEVESLDLTPTGWLRIYLADDNGKIHQQTSFDFHSLRCVERWAKERRIALNGVSNRSSYNDAAARVKEAIDALEGSEFTSNDIQELSGIGQSTVDRHLRAMMESGTITDNGKTLKDRRYRSTTTTTEG